MRQEKHYLLDDIKQLIDKHGNFVIMKYAGVPANTVNQFRRDVASAGGNVEMMRKRILVKAFAQSGINIDVDQLPGHISVVFGGSDPMETAKLVFKFRQETDKAVEVVGGRFEGKVFDGAQVETLSKLPSKDEMRAQLLATLEAPMAQTLAVFEALLSGVVYCLDNKSKQQDGAPSA